MKIDEGVNGKIHDKLRQILNSKAIFVIEFAVKKVNFPFEQLCYMKQIPKMVFFLRKTEGNCS